MASHSVSSVSSGDSQYDRIYFRDCARCWQPIAMCRQRRSHRWHALEPTRQKFHHCPARQEKK